MKFRDIATSLTTTVFFVVGTTGVLMYFHILDKYTKSMHEILGLAFVVVVFGHIFVNWKAMKNYFSKKMFLSAVFITALVALGFIYNSSTQKGENPKGLILQSVLKAPINISSEVLSVGFEDAKVKLEKAGISINGASIDEIAKNNKTSPFRIVSIITEK